MIERMGMLSPDVMCLTEAFEGSTVDLGGFEISSRGVIWSDEGPLERKVVLWSRMPWTDIDLTGNQQLQTGGFTAATTTMGIGQVRVVGLCVPHHMASPVGIAPCRPWSQQIEYLKGLKSIISTRAQSMPMVVLGDFNQFVPRIWGSKLASSVLSNALDGLSICTAGEIPVVNEPAIDHMALSSELQALSVHGIAKHDTDGRKLSDHFGVAVELGLVDTNKSRP
ncbi:hypothetical protein X768_16740 [Mesorhizobium sp. LSJC265A00]|nr:hypothetical protein X768_16740 [Mesorhizobium sp. LSJC265A00]